MPGKSEFARLPKAVIPINYNLCLKPSLEEFTFDGKVDIEVKVLESTNEIVLNCADIEIASATYCQKDMTILESTEVTFAAAEEKVTIKFETPLALGSGALSILFKGELNNKMRGFYRCRYTLDGETRYGAATQFAATDARRCFPCWDEPALKATFDVSLVVPKERAVLSNMNVIFEGEYFEDSNLKMVKYARTPVMSTYLLAFVIGDYDYVEGKTKQGLPVRVYTPKGKASQGQFALDVAVKALSYYEEYFNIPYPLPKMDLITVSEFYLGAMENWGLITYRETALLMDEQNSSAQTRKIVCLIVSHELVHQWFGNLVTMEWWTHLWLNEGFASFIAYFATDRIHPEFDIWSQFMSHDFKRGVDLDALDSSHPIEVPVENPDQIGEIFDAISYSKGASILRMLHNWIGDDCFRKAMHNYLTEHAYKNAMTEDLWDALDKTSGKPVRKVMESWTKQTGFPIVSVAVQSRTDSSVTLKLSQKKFCANPRASTAQSPKWLIPVAFSTTESADKPVKSILLQDESMEVTLENVSQGSWIKVNPGTYGFYRVQYPSDLLSALLPAVKGKNLPVRDRFGIENDLFALAACGLSPTTDFLEALAAYENETDYSIWNDLDSNISSLSVLLWNDKESHDKFKTFILQLYNGLSDSLGWDAKEGEGHLDAVLRSLIIHRTGLLGCSKTIEEARKRFDSHLSNEVRLPADLRSPVFSIALAHGNQKEFEELIQLHDNSDLHEDKVRIERCMGCLPGTDMIGKVLDFTMSEKVRSNDRVYMFGSASASCALGRDLTWNFVKTNWEKLYEVYKGTPVISRLIKLITDNFASEEMADDVKEFFKKNTSSADRAVQQAVENIGIKSDWWSRDGKSICAWISSKVQK